MRVRALLFFVAAGALLGACRYDPVPQQIIDGLGDESGSPSATHRPGQPCLACHTTYEGASPALSIGGTVFTQDDGGNLIPAPKVLVTVTDSTGDTRMACTNASGNYFIQKDAWPDITFPLAATAGDRSMRSLIGRNGSCAHCHKLPAAGAPLGSIGEAADSPGVVIVSPDATDPTCGGGS